MLKISISGTFSSGKTTLCNMLQVADHNISVIPDSARQLKVSFPHIDLRSQAFQDFILINQFVVEKSAAGIAVCDNSIVDSLAYSRLHRLEDRLELLDQFSHRAYDYLFICDPHDVPIVDDGVRHIDGNMRNRLQSYIVEIANILAYQYIVLSGPPSDRLHTVMEVLETHRRTNSLTTQRNPTLF